MGSPEAGLGIQRLLREFHIAYRENFPVVGLILEPDEVSNLGAPGRYPGRHPRGSLADLNLLECVVLTHSPTRSNVSVCRPPEYA